MDKAEQNAISQTIGDKLAASLEGIFASVALTRRQHFEENPSKRPSSTDIDAIIKSYGNQNAVIAGAANLIPGPWGAAAILPELALVIRNQIQMIYDLGVAHGKESHLNAHLLLGIFATVMGGGAIGVATVKGGQMLVKRASLRVIQKIVVWLGGKITQRVLKQFIAKWLPIAGAIGMAAWARQSTIKMGKAASLMLSKDIVYSDQQITEDDIPS